LYPNLKLQIWRAGIRQNRLAQILGLDETTLSRIVNGFRRPGEDLKAKIAEVLKSDQAWLFEESIRNVQAELPAEKGPLAG